MKQVIRWVRTNHWMLLVIAACITILWGFLNVLGVTHCNSALCLGLHFTMIFVLVVVFGAMLRMTIRS